MLDLGKLPIAIQEAVVIESEVLDGYISDLLGAVLPDESNSKSAQFLSKWENMLDITSPPSNFNQRINVIKSRLNALGSLGVGWFYKLAGHLGWTRAPSVPGNTPAGLKHIRITDGETLSFRAGINAAGDTVYDNINYTSLTINVYYKSQGAVLDNALIQTFLFTRSLGTTFLFWRYE